MKYIIIFIFLLHGCTNKYDECLEQQKAEYRQSNPKASYGQVQNKQFEFELMCSKYKSK